MKNLKITVLKSKHGPTYKLSLSGKANGIEFVGRTTQVLIGIDTIEFGLADKVTIVNRMDGSGKSLSFTARRRVVLAVLSKLQEIDLRNA